MHLLSYCLLFNENYDEHINVIIYTTIYIDMHIYVIYLRNIYMQYIYIRPSYADFCYNLC